MPFKLIVGSQTFVDKQIAALVPDRFDLAQNYPNPFNLSTSITVKMPHAAQIRLEVYSVLGQRVKTLAAGTFGAGTHTFEWDGTDGGGMTAASGVYIYRLAGDDGVHMSKKMILAK